MTRAFSAIIPLLFIITACNNNAGNSQNSSENQKTQKQVEGFHGPDISCFVYHRFGDDRYPSTNISVDKFEKHLQYLQENNFEVVTFGEAVDLINNGESGDQRYAVITVDDAYKSFKTGAMPLLEEYNMPATVFVNTNGTGGKSYMDWETLRALQEKGIEIGHHSHSHAQFLNKKDPKKAFKEDTRKGQQLFKEKLGEAPDIYAYPYGEYNVNMQEVLKDMGFKAAAAQHSGVMYPGSNLYALPRFPMASSFTKFEEFKEKAGMKGLRVTQENPKEVVFQENPPKLELTIDQTGISAENIQCFVSTPAGCKVKKDLSGNEAVITFQADEPLKTRRIKYTITAPSKDGKQWFWYSKLWVMPDEPEDP